MIDFKGERVVFRGIKSLAVTVRCALMLPLALTALPGWAVGSADELIRQQQRDDVLRQQLESRPEVRLQGASAPEKAQLPLSESPCFTIERIRLVGEGSADFQWALNALAPGDDSPVGRCLGTEGIHIVLKRVQSALVAKGYVTTRVLVGTQDLSTGTLALTIVPGHIRAIRFTADSSERATAWTAFPMKAGDLLNLRDIEQALENLKRAPTAEADIQIVPSEGTALRPGDSDLLVTWKQGLPLRLTLTADDSGTKASGKRQGSATVSGDDLLSLHDLFYLTLNHDLERNAEIQGTQGGTVFYSVPFGYWLFSVSHNTYSYHQTVAGASQRYVYSGDSANNDIRLSRLVWRDANSKTTLGGRIW